MKCPKCQAESPDNAKFCLECGSSISASSGAPTADTGVAVSGNACDQRGAKNAPDAKFCESRGPETETFPKARDALKPELKCDRPTTVVKDTPRRQKWVFASVVMGVAVVIVAVLVWCLPALRASEQRQNRHVFAQAEVAQAEADILRPGTERDFEIVPGVKMTFCWIPATTSAAWKQLSGGKDTFAMGSPQSEADRDGDETSHEVRLTKGFWLGKYEVTQAQWQAVMGNNPSYFKGPRNPVEQVSWNDCRAFIQKLGQGHRLPTEAEWGYACRAGVMKKPYSGDLEQMGWYRGGSATADTTHPVGQKAHNAWGLHDMHGNVWEWCADWYGNYPSGMVVDPTGPASGVYRVFRGGSWDDHAGLCRSASRGYNDPNFRKNFVGFRLVRDAP